MARVTSATPIPLPWPGLLLAGEHGRAWTTDPWMKEGAADFERARVVIGDMPTAHSPADSPGTHPQVPPSAAGSSERESHASALAKKRGDDVKRQAIDHSSRR